MKEKAVTNISIEKLRLKIATNHFKRKLLGDLHLSGKAQASTVFEELLSKRGELEISDRTWQSWFSNKDTAVKVGKGLTLDKMSTWAFSDSPSNYYSEMLHGGLLNQMLGSLKSKESIGALISQARSYQPISQLHLQIDAIEVGAIKAGYGNIGADELIRIAAERILQCLHDRWNPRNGSIYAKLSSSLSCEWDVATPDERAEIRKCYARFKPDLFEHDLHKVPRPNWENMGIDPDVPPMHIYKVLFALAADPKFLVADRLVAWSLDLATAALAMHAKGWVDGQTTFETFGSEELSFWCALDEIFFRTDSIDKNNLDIVGAMSRLNANWTMESFESFSHARETYQSELRDLGVSERDVYHLAMQITKNIEC